MEVDIKKANYVFKSIDKKLTSRYKGKIVAIEGESGDYFIGNSELDAYQKAIAKHPGKLFVFERIGYDAAYFVGVF